MGTHTCEGHPPGGLRSESSPFQNRPERVRRDAELAPERVVHRRRQEDQERDEDRQDCNEDGVKPEVFDPEEIGQEPIE